MLSGSTPPPKKTKRKRKKHLRRCFFFGDQGLPEQRAGAVSLVFEERAMDITCSKKVIFFSFFIVCLFCFLSELSPTAGGVGLRPSPLSCPLAQRVALSSVF